MKPARDIVRDLAARDWLDLTRTVCAEHHATLGEVCGGARTHEAAWARHAVWERLAPLVGTYSGIARLFGVHHSTVLVALQHGAITEVVLDAAPVSERSDAELVWSSRGSHCYGVRLAGRTQWFLTLAIAREHFESLTASTAQARAAPDPSPPMQVGGGAS